LLGGLRGLLGLLLRLSGSLLSLLLGLLGGLLTLLDRLLGLLLRLLRGLFGLSGDDWSGRKARRARGSRSPPA